MVIERMIIIKIVIERMIIIKMVIERIIIMKMVIERNCYFSITAVPSDWNALN